MEPKFLVLFLLIGSAVSIPFLGSGKGLGLRLGLGLGLGDGSGIGSGSGNCGGSNGCGNGGGYNYLQNGVPANVPTVPEEPAAQQLCDVSQDP